MKSISLKVILCCSILLMWLCIIQEEAFSQNIDNTNYKEAIAEVLSVSNNQSVNISGFSQTTQTVKIKVLDGDLKEKTFITDNVLNDNPGYDIIIKPKDKVIINYTPINNGKYEVIIASNYRVPGLIVIFVLFAFLLILLGRMKGLKSLISLGLTYFLIFMVLIPCIINGMNPILITLGVSVTITCVSIFVVTGINYKGISAIIGTIGGIFIALLISIIAIKITALTGTPNEESIALWAMHKSLDIKGIFASSLIIGALGVSIDVAMSISSSIFELKTNCPDATSKELINAGMNVGKDLMGANTNTLLLAYTGSALYLLLLVYNNISLTKLFNLDSIVSEIIIALAGSIALLLCIPITAYSAGFLQKFIKD